MSVLDRYQLFALALAASVITICSGPLAAQQKGSADADIAEFYARAKAGNPWAAYDRYLPAAEKRNGHWEVLAQPQFFLLPKTVQAAMLTKRARENVVRIMFAVDENRREQAGTFREGPGGLKITAAKAAKAVRQLDKMEVDAFKLLVRTIPE